LKTSYTEEALADIVSALTYLNERSPAAAVKLDADIEKCVDRLAAQEFDGPVSRLKSGAQVRSCAARSEFCLSAGSTGWQSATGNAAFLCVWCSEHGRVGWNLTI
jgi:plasmid stabilization system protein ParE